MDLSNENVVHIKKNKVEYIQFRRLLEYKNKITHAYSVGVDSNYRTENTTTKNNTDENNQRIKKVGLENYKKLCIANGLDINKLIKPNQKHTTNVDIVKDELLGESEIASNRYDNTDGLVTDKKEVVLATTSADCISLLFYDPIKNVIANVHSGWKGTLGKISENTVKIMKNKYNCKPEEIICCICPSIRKCHFEVEKDVRDLFYEEFKNLEEIHDIIEETIKNKKWHIDTVLINKILLINQGLKPKNIVDSKLCSVCNSDIIHSCRAEKAKGKKQFGLNTAIIKLN